MLAKGTTRLYGTWIPRSLKYAPKGVKGIISFGQQHGIQWVHDEFEENFFKQPESVALEFGKDMSMYLGMDYDASHFVDLHRLGYLPIKVKALPEGIETPNNIPHMTFINTVDGFAWLTLYLETIISSLCWKAATSGIVPTLGQEYHICGTMSSSGSIKIYVDGVLKATTAGVSSDYRNMYVTIGARRDAANRNWFDGNIRDVKFFNTALSAEDIANYANQTMWTYKKNCTVNLPMGLAQHDPTNFRTLDVSGNGNHAIFGDGSTSSTFPTKIINRHGYSFDGVNDYLQLPSVTGNYPYMLIDYDFSESSVDYTNISTTGGLSGIVSEIRLYIAELSTIQKYDLQTNMLSNANRV
jgi:hypothetical protein